MGAETPALTTLKSQQFVGYWGYGNQEKLQALLTKGLNWGLVGKSIQQIKPQGESFAGNDRGWSVGVISTQTVPIQLVSECTIAFSASGLLESVDAWVTLHTDRLTLGRESFGRSPLFWTQQGDVIWFASQLQLLLPIVESLQLNISGLYGYSCFSYVPTPLTPITEIFALPAGVEQTWHLDSAHTLRSSQWQRSFTWQEFSNQIVDEALAVTELQTLLKDAVHSQITDLNHEPVGVFLSGGLDSSVVAALLIQAGVKVRAYTLDFGSAGISETPYAEQVAQFLNIPLVKVEVTPRKICQALIPTVRSLDLPFGDGVTVPLFLLSEAASQEVSVIFNGEGGDQLFAGWTNKPLIAAGIYQTEHPTEKDSLQQYLRTFHRLWGYERQVFQPDVYKKVRLLEPSDWLQEALDPAFCSSLLHRLRRATLMLKGAQNIQPRATNLGVAHGLKVRSPFCDLTLAQWTFRLSGNLCLQGSCEKYILKRAVEPWLPNEIVWRSKRGMGVPLTSWCLHELWHDLGIWLNPQRLSAEGIWNPNLATQIVSGKLGTIQGRRIGEILWLLIMWQVWTQTVLEKSSHDYSFNHPFWLPAWLGQQYLHLRRELEQW